MDSKKNNEKLGVELQNETISFLGEEYTLDEFRSACENLSNFFSILHRWQLEDDGHE